MITENGLKSRYATHWAKNQLYRSFAQKCDFKGTA